MRILASRLSCLVQGSRYFLLCLLRQVQVASGPPQKLILALSRCFWTLGHMPNPAAGCTINAEPWDLQSAWILLKTESHGGDRPRGLIERSPDPEPQLQRSWRCIR